MNTLLDTAPFSGTTTSCTRSAASSASSVIPTPRALTVLGLHALQHRGQEAAGIVSFDGAEFHSERHVGLVGDSFTDRAVVDRLPGDRAIGHVRYSTHGGSIERNIQPLFAEFSGGGFAVAHNGNLTNALTLQDKLQRRGSIFQSTSDTEVILHLIATSRRDRLVERMIDALAPGRGRLFAGLPVVEEDDRLPRSARRPPAGPRRSRRRARSSPRRPARSTSSARRFVRDIEPGEMVVITHGRDREPAALRAGASAASASSNTSISRARIRRSRAAASTRCASGSARSLPARRRPTPTSSCRCPIPARRRRSALPRHPASPSISASSATTMSAAPSSSRRDAIRHMGVRLKHNANRAVLAGKRVVLVDDSIVRGTTSLKIVQMVRDAGASRGPHADRQPADHPFLLLRRRHAGALAS